MMDMELFRESRTWHEQGAYAEAADGYQRLLAQDPHNAQLCYLQALLYFELDLLDAAAEWFRKSISLAPGLASAHYNLGVIHFAQGNLEAAAASYEAAAALNPHDTDTLFNLGLTLKKQGRFDKALATYNKALTLSPDDADLLYNIGVLYMDMGESARAVHSLEEVVKRQADHGPAINNLAYLYHRQGQEAKAMIAYERLIELDHNAAMAAHMLAALRGHSTSSAPATYIREVFDSFSDHYDQSLVDRLGYTTPSRLRQMVPTGTHCFRRGLDMGCGTGLSGQAFCDLTDTLIGLDLSTKMLALAAEKEIYHHLHETDIHSFLRESRDIYDLVLAADVFVYIGDLREIFRLVRQHSRPGTLFLFSTELAEGDYQIKSTGRYGHSRKYIDELAAEEHFAVLDSAGANLRREKDSWIAGNLYVLEAL